MVTKKETIGKEIAEILGAVSRNRHCQDGMMKIGGLEKREPENLLCTLIEETKCQLAVKISQQGRDMVGGLSAGLIGAEMLVMFLEIAGLFIVDRGHLRASMIEEVTTALAVGVDIVTEGVIEEDIVATTDQLVATHPLAIMSPATLRPTGMTRGEVEVVTLGTEAQTDGIEVKGNEHTTPCDGYI